MRLTNNVALNSEVRLTTRVYGMSCCYSAVYNWSSLEVAEWMVLSVELPELAEVIKRYDITGHYLPM